MEVFYGTSVSDTNRGFFPELKVINLVPEGEATEEGRMPLQSRRGLSDSGVDFGTSPVKNLFKLDGVLGNGLFGVSGTSLYNFDDGLIGAINGTGHVSFAGFETNLFVCAGESIWGYDGTTLSEISFPDSVDVQAIAVGASRLIAIRKDTGIFYWSDPLSSTIDALSFATAENSPDRLKDLLFIGDTLILFGAETVEFWPATTDNNLPFAPLQGRVFQEGIRDTGCATKYNSTFAWITDDNQICISDPNNVISTPTIEDKLAASSVARLWTFEMFQTQYLALTLDNQTYCYTLRYGQWVEFKSYNQTNWLPRCHAEGYFGSSLDGSLYTWSDDYRDFENIMERRLSLWVPLGNGGFPVYNLLCRVSSGTTTDPSLEPVAELRTSRDGGGTWSNWKQRSLQKIGNFGEKVMWKSLGLFKFPGGLAEIRVTDDVPFRFSGATVNNGY